MSTSSNSSSDDEFEPKRKEHRVAKKSTTNQHQPPTSGYSTRRQLRTKNLRNSAADRFMENFNPETSTREKRKLFRKINPPSNVKRPPGALYDENGIYINAGVDLCDCLNEECVGCFFECAKCESNKCGTECRVHRKFIVDQVEYHGYDNIIKNPLMKYQ